jgi:hypothetical protein
MTDVAPETHKDGQASQLTQADDYAPQKCTFANCKEVQVFPTKASLKYPTLLSKTLQK